MASAWLDYDFVTGWQAQVNVTNLTDKEYVASSDYWCYYGESRSLTYRW